MSALAIVPSIPQVVVGYDCRGTTYFSFAMARHENHKKGTYAGVDCNCWERPDDIVHFADSPEVFVGANSHLWDKLAHLSAFVANNDMYHSSIVAISLILDHSNVAIRKLPFAGRGILHTDTAVPLEVQSSWEHLGYDVADAFFQSALCYYLPCFSEKQFQTVCLTESGCFATYEEAELVRRLLSERAEDHGPFFVFALFEVPRSSW